MKPQWLCFVALAALAACASAPVAPPSAAETFTTHCASCHGVSGRGDGPVAEVIAVPVPNLRTLSRRYGGQFPAEYVASYIDGRNLPPSHGERQMPVWGAIFDTTARLVTDAESAQARIDSIIEYLRGIQEP
jgi:mono/diheme cytochrome c family protein